MPRPRTFDDDAVIDAAMIAFWRCGYTETPIADLEAATGIKRISLYNAWGDKEGLFLAALDRYHHGAAEVYDGMVATEGLDGIVRLLQGMTAPAPEGAPAHSGCLMVNTILDLRRATPAVREKVATYRAMIRGALVAALRSARDTDEIDADDAAIEARADHLLTILWGSLALIRLEGRTTAAADAARIACETVEGWRRD